MKHPVLPRTRASAIAWLGLALCAAAPSAQTVAIPRVPNPPLTSDQMNAAVPLRAQVTPVPEIRIRLYNAFGFASDDVRTAQDIAGAILQAAGVQAWWRECWSDGGVSRGDTPVCGDTLHPTEVIVRIVTDRSEQRGNLIALGYSLVTAETGTATLATVFGNRVTQLAQRVHFERAVLLGRAIAHEVGHLLLGSRAHATDGLMGAHWSAAALHARDEDWRFSPQEAEQIRGELLARRVPGTDLLVATASAGGNKVRLDEQPK